MQYICGSRAPALSFRVSRQMQLLKLKSLQPFRSRFSLRPFSQTFCLTFLSFAIVNGSSVQPAYVFFRKNGIDTEVLHGQCPLDMDELGRNSTSRDIRDLSVSEETDVVHRQSSMRSLNSHSELQKRKVRREILAQRSARSLSEPLENISICLCVLFLGSKQIAF